jgi:hypothetical protein
MLETSTTLETTLEIFQQCWKRRRRWTIDVDRRRRRSSSMAGRFNGPLMTLSQKYLFLLPFHYYCYNFHVLSSKFDFFGPE